MSKHAIVSARWCVHCLCTSSTYLYIASPLLCYSAHLTLPPIFVLSTMHFTLYTFLVILTMMLSYSLAQYDREDDLSINPLSSSDVALDIPVYDPLSRTNQILTPLDDGTSSDHETDCNSDAENHIEERDTTGQSNKNPSAAYTDPPFECKKGKPACCVYPPARWNYLCKSWSEALILNCLKQIDWMCCESFDAEGFGVNCDKEYDLIPKTTEQKHPPAVCPVRKSSG